MTTAELVGGNIRRIRLEQGLEMGQFAYRLGRTKNWLYQLELGRGGRNGSAGVSVDELVRIATVLGVDVLDLFCDPDDNIRHKLIDSTRRASAKVIEEADAFVNWRIARETEESEPKRAAR